MAPVEIKKIERRCNEANEIFRRAGREREKRRAMMKYRKPGEGGLASRGKDGRLAVEVGEDVVEQVSRLREATESETV